MAIEAIQATTAIQGNAGLQELGNNAGMGSFGAFLDQMEKNEVGVQNKLASYINGSSPLSVHDVMLEIERSRLMLSLALQVRNKIVEGVQELYRTPI